MRKLCALCLAFVLGFAFTACSGSGQQTDYSFEALALAMEAAEGASSLKIETETDAKIVYKQSSTTAYDMQSTRRATLAFHLDGEGNITEYAAKESAEIDGQKSAYSVYYCDGTVYIDEEGRRFKESFDASVLKDGSLFLFFNEDEVEDYRVSQNTDSVTVTFRVPWESTSDKVVQLYRSLAEMINSTGVAFTNVRYDDIKASFKLDRESGRLLEYSYTYTAEMTVTSTGKTMSVEGKSTCRILESGNVTITPPDLSLYE